MYTNCTSFNCPGFIADSRVFWNKILLYLSVSVAKLKIIFFGIKSTLNERRETSVLFVCCKIGKEESVGTPGKGIFPVSCLLTIAWSDKKNCTSTKTTETRHALCRNRSKTSARFSSEVPNTEKRMKTRRRRRSAFIVSGCLEPLMKTEARVFELASQTNVRI